jgi:hypothetical protein
MRSSHSSRCRRAGKASVRASDPGWADDAVAAMSSLAGAFMRDAGLSAWQAAERALAAAIELDPDLVLLALTDG